ncbi:MAG: response regulator [Bacteriovoracaceae bacterium]
MSIREKKIILVDDMITNHMIFKNHVKDLNYIVDCHKDSQLFSSNLSKIERPDLFVLDIEMPGLSGLELADILKKNEKFQDVPIIFFSTLDDEQVLTEAYKVGAVEFLNKSMKGTELRLRLKNILHLEELKHELHKELRINQILFRVLFHDLANLLAIIDGNLRVSMKKLLEHPTYQRLEKSAKSMDQLMEILDSIRSLVKTTHKEVSVSLKETFEIVQFIFHEKLEQKKINLVIEIADDLFVKIPRAFLVHQILSNFISNSIKFTPVEGNIIIKANQTDSSIFINIIDQGTGMSPEVIKKILSEDQFHSSSGTQDEVGSGSGVKIAQFFLDKFSVKLSYRSEQNVGTTVTLEFPSTK